MIDVFVIIEDTSNDDFDHTVSKHILGFVTTQREAVAIVAKLTKELEHPVHPGYPIIPDDWRGSQQGWEEMHDAMYAQHAVVGYSYEGINPYKPS